MLTDIATQERIGRERDFWDRLYGERSRNHEDTFAERYVSRLAYSRQVLHAKLDGLHHMRILSIGGGVDHLAIHLARRENTVVTVDISPVAAELTDNLAREHGVAARVSTLIGNCEEIDFKNSFHVVLCKRSLHHMNLRAVVPNTVAALASGGMFLAEEPICFLDIVQWFHRTFPFHPDPVRTADEKELTAEDVAFVSGHFRECRTEFFDLLTRESIVYFLCKSGLENLLTPLGRVDYFLTNRYLRSLRLLSSYVLIEGRK